MSHPYIRFNEKLEITDVSQITKSLSKVSSGKDFLAYLIGDDHVRTLEELCLCDGPWKAIVMPLQRKRGSYRFAAAVRCADGGAVLYMLTSADVPILESPNIISTEPDHLHLSGDLAFDSTPTDGTSFANLLRRTVESLTESFLPRTCRVRTLPSDSLSACNTVFSVSTEGLLLAVSSLICALGAAGLSEVELSVLYSDTSPDIRISAETGSIPPFIGSSDDIPALIPYLSAGSHYLRRACDAAEFACCAVSAEFSPGGKLCFTIANVHSTAPALEFKFPFNTQRTEATIRKVLSLLSGAKEQQHEE